MESVGIWMISAMVFACLGGIYVSVKAVEYVDKKRAAAEALGRSRAETAYLYLRKGVPVLMPFAGLLLKAASIRDEAERAANFIGNEVSEQYLRALLSVVLAAALACSVVVALVVGSVVSGIAVGCAVCVGVFLFVHNKADKEDLSMREDVPDALRSMSTCFRSGLSLVQTLGQTSTEVSPALGKLFKTAQLRLEMGATPSEALEVLRQNKSVPELAFVSVALDVQHHSGGSIAPVLESAIDSVSSELDLMRSLRVQTAQAKLSAGIVTAMPFVLIAMFSMMSPGFLAPFFESVPGVLLLALALLMQASGVICVRHMLKVNGG